MFSLASGLYKEFFSSPQINLLVVGVQGSGKTTVLERIKVTEFTYHHVADRRNAAPERLRSKIFVSDDPEHYEAPMRRRKVVMEAPPQSRFVWICPQPPKFQAFHRLDTSDREVQNDSCHYEESEYSETMHEDEDNLSLQAARIVDQGGSVPLVRVAVRRNSADASHQIAAQSKKYDGLSMKSGSAHGPNNTVSPRHMHGAGDGTRRSSMESIDLESSSTPRLPSQPPAHHTDEHDERLQFDLKHGAKMLPTEKIRPTIGMNLGKSEIVGCNVHVWDLGGKLQDLWERYYADADAVLFVWKLQRDGATNNDADDEDSVRVPMTVEHQRKVLEQVRAQVPDDVPFAILGNLFQQEPPYKCEPDVLYSTNQLLPHYHNPYQAMFVGNAVTGQGIKTATEWLIARAKRQKRVRAIESNGAHH